MRWLFGLVVALYVGFAVAYALATPYRTPGVLLGQRDAQGRPQTTADVGAPDERQHANYIKHLLNGQGFPVLRPGTSDLYETYQSHQPPAYYLLATAWAKLLGLDPALPGAGLPLRALNILIGVLTLVGVYRATAIGFGNEGLGILAAAMTGLTPMFLALNSAVSNDPLLFCLGSWGLVGLAQVLREGWSRPRAAMMVGILGLALLTKTTALALFPTVIAAALLAEPSRRTLSMRWSALCLCGAGLIALPWWIRNLSLYGDPLGLRAFREAFVGTAQRDQMIQMVTQIRAARGLDTGGAAYEYWTQWFGWWTLRSWFGAFGQMDIFMPPFTYAVLAIVAVIGVLGWVLGFKTLRDDPAGRAYAITALVFTGVVALLFLQFNLTYFQAQGRYLYPAVAAIVGGLAFGLHYATRRVPVPVLIGVTIAVGVGLNLFTLNFLSEQFVRRTTVVGFNELGRVTIEGSRPSI